MRKKFQRRLFNALYACPHGVIAMSQDIPGLVETSTNLASIKAIGEEIPGDCNQSAKQCGVGQTGHCRPYGIPVSS